MKSKNWMNNFIIGMVCFYGMVAVFLRYSKPDDPEIFPFFAWDFFDYIPNLRTEYSIEIINYNGVQFNPSKSFFENNFVNSQADLISVRKLIQDFALAYVNHGADFEKKRIALESSYLGNVKKYSLVKSEYNPIEMYKKGIVKKEVIGIFNIYDR